MKRILALLLVIVTLVFYTGSLYSCEIIKQNDANDFAEENQPEDNKNDIELPDDGSSDDTDDPDKPDDTNNPDDSGNGDVEGKPDQPDNPKDPDDPNGGCSTGNHVDNDNSDYCDLCNEYLIVVIDFYAMNDLHGKFCDTDSQIGLDELGTYFTNRREIDDHVVFLSTGDMWQGTAESNLTRGVIITEWMNAMGFDAMTVGNHDYDWGSSTLENNFEVAEFPFLAINIYDSNTNQPVDYCSPSVLVERGGIKIGIIGAIGDCYSSISSDMVEDVYFKVGSELTNLVKAESERLRSLGADLIVYQLHDGYTSNSSGSSSIATSKLANYYESVLSSGGYVDVVFEAHTHKYYTLKDSSGVYHIQGGGENSGISHIEFAINSANGNKTVTDVGFVRSSSYSNLEDDPATEALEEKYSEIITYAYSDLGVVSKYYSDVEIEAYVASLYLEAGLEKWGNEYDIVLGGGFLRTRSPYDLSAGTVCYADILSLLPFDNSIVLCKISGSNLLNKFINSTNSDYYVAMSEYGNNLSISSSKQYYIVVDTYTALYAPNGLTIVEYYDNSTFARDLFAEKIKAGEFEVKHDSYTLTSIPEALEIGNALGSNTGTSKSYYIKGTVKSITSTTYGNMYIVDENGNEIYLYGISDSAGNGYSSMTNKPKVGDTITVYATIYKYVNGSTVIVELKGSVLV